MHGSTAEKFVLECLKKKEISVETAELPAAVRRKNLSAVLVEVALKQKERKLPAREPDISIPREASYYDSL